MPCVKEKVAWPNALFYPYTLHILTPMSTFGLVFTSELEFVLKKLIDESVLPRPAIKQVWCDHAASVIYRRVYLSHVV